MTKERLPVHMKKYYYTLRNFKCIKRSQLRILRKRLNKFMEGSAFFPNEAYYKMREAHQLIDEAYEHLKPWWKNA